MSLLSREALAAMRSKPPFLYFWSHEGTGVGPRVLSQWYPAPFSLDGDTWPTAEQWMMASKARLYGNEKVAAAIRAAAHPKEARVLIRRVKVDFEARWDAEIADVVLRGNRAKFEQHPELADYLRSTAPAVLVEASPHDRVLGIGLPESDGRARDSRLWLGENLLGFTLMRLREELMPGTPPGRR